MPQLNNFFFVFVILMTFAAVFASVVLLKETRNSWKKLRNEASLKRKVDLILILILTIPITLVTAYLLVMITLSALGIVK